MKTFLRGTVVTALIAGASVAQAATVGRAQTSMPSILQKSTSSQLDAALKDLDRELAKKDVSDRDRLQMTKARLLYENSRLRDAIASYEQIPSDSDYWLESLEERAWAHLRLDEPDRALAILRTIQAPLFRSIVGPESYFLVAFIRYRICDFPAVFTSLKEFQEAYRDRLTSLQALADGKASEPATKVLASLREKPLVWSTIAQQASKLPLYLHRDREMQRLASALRRSEPGASAQAMERLRELARLDLTEIKRILQKMHILEAEVIQRIHTAEKMKSRRLKPLEIADRSEVLIFKDTGEFWADELDRYQVQVNACRPMKVAEKPSAQPAVQPAAASSKRGSNL